MILEGTLLLAQLVCGTSPEMHWQAMSVDVARPRAARSLDYARDDRTRVADNVLYVRADEETAPFDDPADLEGISLYFARRGASSFAVTREPLRYDEEVGPQFVAF